MAEPCFALDVIHDAMGLYREKRLLIGQVAFQFAAIEQPFAYQESVEQAFSDERYIGADKALAKCHG